MACSPIWGRLLRGTASCEKIEEIMENKEKARQRYKRFMELHPGYRKTPDMREYASKWRKENAERIKQYRKSHPDKRKTRRRVAVPDFDSILKSQDYKCAICKVEDSELNRVLSVDHDHSTGKIRGLLCHHCNTGLGLFRDNPELLRRAISYLETSVDSLPKKNGPLEYDSLQT